MASLLDVAGKPRTVPVNGVDVAVYGISGHGIAMLMQRFPEIGKLFSGIQPDADALQKMGPPALAAVIAAGTGDPGDEKAEKVAENLSLGVQLELIDEIFRATFPKGLGPFVERLRALGLLAQKGVSDLSALQSQKPAKS